MLITYPRARETLLPARPSGEPRLTLVIFPDTQQYAPSINRRGDRGIEARRDSECFNHCMSKNVTARRCNVARLSARTNKSLIARSLIRRGYDDSNLTARWI